jgi:hypothetical protein
MAFTVVYDANVLYPNTLRDLLIRISQAGLVQAKWTDEILDEMLRALSRNRPDIPPYKLDRLRQLMNEAVRDCLVSGYEPSSRGSSSRIQPTGMCWQRRSSPVPRSSSPAI